jgi:hypothetical protein
VKKRMEQKTENKREAGMKYIDGELYQIIKEFEDLGNFDNARQAQKKLAEKLRGIPLGKLLNPPQRIEKKEEKEPAFTV